MKTTQAPTLSEHLLREASRFCLYPKRVRRDRGNLAMQELIDLLLRQHAEWRTTFAPASAQGNELLTKPVWLDELYCRDRLRAIPGMVERTRNLVPLTLSEVDPQSFVYLREAANCYIHGFPDATVALSRAAVEARLRTVLSKPFGKAAVGEKKLGELINDLATRGRLLSPLAKSAANKIRSAATDVLHHKKPTDSGAALDVLEAARAVILELRGR